VGSDFNGRTLKSAVVHFSWIVVPIEKTPAVTIPEINSAPPQVEEAPSSTGTTIETQPSSTDLFQVLPAPSSTENAGGAFRWFPFITPAFAEEVATATSPLIPESSGTESSSQPTMEIPFDPSTPPPSPKVSGVAPTSEGVLEISYSLDGSQWNFLGYVGPDNWREASSFVLPLTSWEQLGSLQISLKGRLPFGSSAPQIYLDGIRVEAESLEPSILSRIFSPETVPSPSSLDEPGVFDPEAKRSEAAGASLLV
jgi:hypothetical protein